MDTSKNNKFKTNKKRQNQWEKSDKLQFMVKVV